MEEAVESLHFAHDTPTPNSETGSLNIMGQEGRENDLGINHIELVARYVVHNALLPT